MKNNQNRIIILIVLCFVGFLAVGYVFVAGSGTDVNTNEEEVEMIDAKEDLLHLFRTDPPRRKGDCDENLHDSDVCCSIGLRGFRLRQ